MARAGPGRLSLAAALGAAAGAGLGLGLLWLLRRQRGGGRRPGSRRAETAAEEAERRSRAAVGALGTAGAGEAAVPTVLLAQDEQLDLLQRLDFVLRSIVELRREVEELRSSLQSLAAEIVGEVRCHLEETQKISRRRRFQFGRDRRDSTGSSSIYFTASSGAANTDDGESEGGYSTANAESDCERESEDGDDAARGRPAPPEGVQLAGLAQLLQQADLLHAGGEPEQREAFQLLLNNKLAYAEQREFLWRLARAHSAMSALAGDADQRRSHAAEGKEELEMALQKWDQSAECHQWYAVLCGQLSEHESIQKRIQLGHLFKEHVDKAIELKPEDPKSYYLLGRWCYQVSHLGWLEKKTAAALFETPPTATVQDALQNFLRVEELSPGFSKAGRVYIAKCYRDLGNNSAAALWMNLASELPVHTKEDADSEQELEEMLSAWQQ